VLSFSQYVIYIHTGKAPERTQAGQSFKAEASFHLAELFCHSQPIQQADSITTVQLIKTLHSSTDP
jgi:hypothetical protein